MKKQATGNRATTKKKYWLITTGQYVKIRHEQKPAKECVFGTFAVQCAHPADYMLSEIQGRKNLQNEFNEALDVEYLLINAIEISASQYKKFKDLWYVQENRVWTKDQLNSQK
jgi:hypothetical protein